MFTIQGQGVLSERLRSFSMQDLSSFQAEGQATNQSSVSTQAASAQHRTRSMMRSKSETGYSKGKRPKHIPINPSRILPSTHQVSANPYWLSCLSHYSLRVIKENIIP